MVWPGDVAVGHNERMIRELRKCLLAANSSLGRGSSRGLMPGR
jgi:hypothetical protein